MPQVTRVAIVGGGPGGLFTAHLLDSKPFIDLEVTLFEATNRLGGKVMSRQFIGGARYEAGVAELYDYSVVGPDPLRQLVRRLGLSTRPLRGGSVVLDGQMLRHRSDIRRRLGQATLDAIDQFRRHAAALLPVDSWYDAHWQDDNAHPWANRTFASVLAEIPDADARRYLAIAAHSDVATEPDLTSGLNGLKNMLMDDPAYIRLYTIDGGIERLTEALARRVSATIRTDTPVVRISATRNHRYAVGLRSVASECVEEFDAVIVALPNPWLKTIRWEGDELAAAMQAHQRHYQTSGHYLRVSARFDRPFWRPAIHGDYWMLDAFGGCCVYDESGRGGDPESGVLGWLIAGADAERMSEWSDERLIEAALASWPEALGSPRETFQEARVHRWLDAVSGLPGGFPVHDPVARHLPEPVQHPALFLVGDYLFDSTLNGTLDSADAVTDLLLTRLAQQRERRRAVEPSQDEVNAAPGRVGRRGEPAAGTAVDIAYHESYAGDLPYEESYLEYFDADYTRDMIEIVWGVRPPFRLLDSGSASGLTLESFANIGIEAWGVENSEHIHGRTPPAWRERNLLGDIRDLPFPDDHFDFTYDTCLCYVPEEDLDQAIGELRRVTRRGLFFGGITTDMTPTVVEKHDLYYGVRTLGTLWEWSERLLRNGWGLAVTNAHVLARAWDCETAANEGDDPWYQSPESLRYCFYSKR